MNRLIKATDPLENATTYTYNPDGEVLSNTNANGKLTAFSYDKDDRPTEIAYAAGTTVTYLYDADNRLSQVADWLSRLTASSYDPRSNLTAMAYPNKVTSNADRNRRGLPQRWPMALSTSVRTTQCLCPERQHRRHTVAIHHRELRAVTGRTLQARPFAVQATRMSTRQLSPKL